MIDDFTIKLSKIQGNGLFSKRSFAKGTVLFRLDGIKINAEERSYLPPKHKENLLQIGDGLWLNVAGTHGIFINHSCSPNCYIKVMVNQAFCYSINPISVGEELTIHYGLNNTTNEKELQCNCGVFGCNKTVSTYDKLPQTMKDKYDGFVQGFVKGK